MRKKMTAKQFNLNISPKMVEMYDITIDDDGNMIKRWGGYVNIELKGSVVLDDDGCTWTIETTAGTFHFWKEVKNIHFTIRRRRVY